jgi:hypothetical protein
MVRTYISSKVGLDLPCHSHMARAERWATREGSPLNLTTTHKILAGQGTRYRSQRPERIAVTEKH